MNSDRAIGTKRRTNPALRVDSAASAAPTVAAAVSLPWLPALLQAADSFFPTGSYAHSFGLEGLVNEGVIRDRDTLHAFITLSVIPSLERTDLPVVAHAWHGFTDRDWSAIADLCTLTSALKTARELRVASENIGRQRAELCAALHPDSLAGEYLRLVIAKGAPHASPVSGALEACVAGAPVEAALASYGYSAITSLVAAAMKLLRIGQNAGQSLVTEMLHQLPAIIARVQSVPRSEIGWFNPWLDIASARHESADARMFIS
jgi:urease accessory protein